MEVVLSGIRSDGTPLVLVRCRCGRVGWLTAPVCFWPRAYATCPCGRSAQVGRQPTLAEADRELADAPQEAAA